MGTCLICRRKQKCWYVGGVSESGALIGQFVKHAKIISDGMYMLCDYYTVRVTVIIIACSIMSCSFHYSNTFPKQNNK